MAAKKKKEHEECERCDAECKEEERELAAAKARVAKYEAEESPGGSDVASDDEIVITGVIDKVSDSGVILEASLLCEQAINHQDSEGCEHCKRRKEVCKQPGPG